MAIKISFLNLKGGVGKTSMIVNVGACLAYMGKRVLIVDLDAQSNSSIWLMRLDRWNAQNRYPEKFALNLFKNPDAKITDCIHKSPVRDLEGEVALESLDLIPASFSLLDLEHDVENKTDVPFYIQFYEHMADIEMLYDFILFDCPPSFYYAPQAAIFNSDWVIVPANADALSIIGFHLLTEKLNKFKEKTEDHRNELHSPTPEIMGVSLNAIKPGVRIDVPVERFENQIERFIEQRKVPTKTELFPTRIRHSITVGRAVMQGQPMVLMPKNEGSMSVAKDYIKTSQYILERCGITL
ncbi:ParA family protein [Puniceicoccaceae bacterium K14]|nr:ParA family protein [Puniceicoccaceae bacterium K14]